jgi:hypothetical protein
MSIKVNFKQDLTKDYLYILRHVRKQIELIENDVPIRRDSDWQKAREGVYRELEWLMQGLTIESEEWVKDVWEK